MLTVIVPTLNEEKVIGRCLRNLKEQRGIAEILVVDGESGDATRKIAEQHGVRVVKSERGIARQLQTGAAAAKGDVLLFLHADCRFAPGAISQFEAILKEGSIHWGAFKQRYDRYGAATGALAAINNTAAQLRRQYRGEQGIFVTKKALGKIGGVPDAVVFEDRKLCRALKQTGLKSALLPIAIISSARRFRHGNDFRTVWRLVWGRVRRGVGVSGYKLKKEYPAVR